MVFHTDSCQWVCNLLQNNIKCSKEEQEKHLHNSVSVLFFESRKVLIDWRTPPNPIEFWSSMMNT